MKPYFTDSASSVLAIASESAGKFGQINIGAEHILLGLIQEKTGFVSRILNENGVDDEIISEMIKKWIPASETVAFQVVHDYSPSVMKIIESSHRQADWFHAEATSSEHIFLAILQDKDNMAVKLMRVLGVEAHKLYIDMILAMKESKSGYRVKESCDENVACIKTETLDKYSRDLTALARAGKLDPLIGREKEIRRMIQILSRRNKNNTCLIGEPGVGKTAIAEGLAMRIAQSKAPDSMLNKRVVALDLGGIVAGSKFRGEFEERFKKIICEVIDAGNILMFLDEIHTIVGAGGAEGAIDASNILKPYLARGEIQLIGATTVEEYRKYIEKEAALERRFQPIVVEEPTVEESIEILNGLIQKYEQYHNVYILSEAVEAAVVLSNRYINNRRLPDKALDLIDEACAAIKLVNFDVSQKLKDMGNKIDQMELEINNLIANGDVERAEKVSEENKELQHNYYKTMDYSKNNKDERVMTIGKTEIADVVSDWTNIPVKNLTEKESEKLLKLELLMHKRIIGQNSAVTAVARAMRRGRIGIQNPNRPIGSFLFLGPTGVGKTELSKVLSNIMFEKEQSFIRIDMSEYMEAHSVSKIIGSPPGYVGFEDGGQLSELVRRNPYSLVLFDEIEKAHPDVLNIFLQILDDGQLTDAKGRKINFKNTIIIMTSNIGAHRIIEPRVIGFTSADSAQESYDKMKSDVMVEVKRTFKPEFINRIDDVIVFSNLNNDDMCQIMTLLVDELADRCEKLFGIKLIIEYAVKQYIVEKHKDSTMGARPLKRAVQLEIEDALTSELLSKYVAPGSSILVKLIDEKIVFTVIENISRNSSECHERLYDKIKS
ncbi:MAG: ATP-dependent Clp protease ATP-binding subunit [Sedimentibacter sp.]|uniref:ATP-dependent Clp protease ATP-binding subunit n=1 Tax=Sedimentibacter sp. TaxID=1960295 RepID=UPI003158D025